MICSFDERKTLGNNSVVKNGFLTSDKEESANQVDISETAVRIRKQ